MNKKYFSVYVGNFNNKTQKIDLLHLFGKYGDIGSIYTKLRAKSDGVNYGFVRYYELACAQRAVEELNGSILQGNRIVVQLDKTTVSRIESDCCLETKKNNCYNGDGPIHRRSVRYNNRHLSTSHGHSNGSQSTRDKYRRQKSRSVRGRLLKCITPERKVITQQQDSLLHEDHSVIDEAVAKGSKMSLGSPSPSFRSSDVCNLQANSPINQQAYQGPLCLNSFPVVNSAFVGTEKFNIPFATLPAEQLPNIDQVQNIFGTPVAVIFQPHGTPLIFKASTPDGTTPAIKLKSEPVLPSSVALPYHFNKDNKNLQVTENPVFGGLIHKTGPVYENELHHMQVSLLEQSQTQNVDFGDEDLRKRQVSLLSETDSGRSLQTYTVGFSDTNFKDEDLRLQQNNTDSTQADNCTISKEETCFNTSESEHSDENNNDLWDPYSLTENCMKNSPSNDFHHLEMSPLTPLGARDLSVMNQTVNVDNCLENCKNTVSDMDVRQLSLPLSEEKQSQYLKINQTSLIHNLGNKIHDRPLQDHKIDRRNIHCAIAVDKNKHNVNSKGSESCQSDISTNSHKVYGCMRKSIKNTSKASFADQNVKPMMADIQSSYQDIDFKSLIVPPPPPLPNSDPPTLPPLPTSAPPPPHELLQSRTNNLSSAEKTDFEEPIETSFPGETEKTKLHNKMTLHPRSLKSSKRQPLNHPEQSNKQADGVITSNEKECPESIKSKANAEGKSWKPNFTEFWKTKLRECVDNSNLDDTKVTISDDSKTFPADDKQTSKNEKRICPEKSALGKLLQPKLLSAKQLNTNIIDAINSKLERTKEILEKKINASKISSVTSNAAEISLKTPGLKPKAQDEKQSSLTPYIDLTKEEYVNTIQTKPRKYNADNSTSSTVIQVLRNKLLLRASCKKIPVSCNNKHILQRKLLKNKKHSNLAGIKYFQVGVDHKTLLKPHGESYQKTNTSLMGMKYIGLDENPKQSKVITTKGLITKDDVNTYKKSVSLKRKVSSKREGAKRLKLSGLCPLVQNIQCMENKIAKEKYQTGELLDKPVMLDDTVIESMPKVSVVVRKCNVDLSTEGVKVKDSNLSIVDLNAKTANINDSDVNEVDLSAKNENIKGTNVTEVDLITGFGSIKASNINKIKKIEDMINVDVLEKELSFKDKQRLACSAGNTDFLCNLSVMPLSQKEPKARKAEFQNDKENKNQNYSVAQEVLKSKQWLSYRAEAIQKINSSYKPKAVAKKAYTVIDNKVNKAVSLSHSDSNASLLGLQSAQTGICNVSSNKTVSDNLETISLENESSSSEKDLKLYPAVSKQFEENRSSVVKNNDLSSINAYTSYLETPTTPVLPTESSAFDTYEYKSWQIGPDVFDLEYLKSLGNFRTDFGVVSDKE